MDKEADTITLSSPCKYALSMTSFINSSFTGQPSRVDLSIDAIIISSIGSDGGQTPVIIPLPSIVAITDEFTGFVIYTSSKDRHYISFEKPLNIWLLLLFGAVYGWTKNAMGQKREITATWIRALSQRGITIHRTRLLRPILLGIGLGLAIPVIIALLIFGATYIAN